MFTCQCNAEKLANSAKCGGLADDNIYSHDLHAEQSMLKQTV